MLKIGVMVEDPSRASGVDAVEILGRRGRLPAPDVLARWRAKMDQDTDVILTAPKALTSPAPEGPLTAPFHPLDEALKLWERVDVAAQVLESPVVLLRTGPDFTPTPTNIERLSAFVSAVERPGRRLVWQPRGLWGEEELETVARRSSLVCAVDPLSEETVTVDGWVYWRIWGLGRSELAPSDLEAILEMALVEDLSGYCLFATGDWKADQRAAGRLVSRLEALRGEL